MSILDKIRERASKNPKKIVLPESEDKRTLEAAGQILNQRIAKLIVVGKSDIVKGIKTDNLKDLEIIDPSSYKEGG